ncbi:hypothetical protein INR49_000153 [Caranx melampygus]|nr:hypothetical protein INR49_000153 [Caranx melampygus]
MEGEEERRKRGGRSQSMEVREKRSGVWRWHRLEEEDVQRVCLNFCLHGLIYQKVSEKTALKLQSSRDAGRLLFKMLKEISEELLSEEMSLVGDTAEQRPSMWRLLSLLRSSHISTGNDLSVQTFTEASDRRRREAGRTQDQYWDQDHDQGQITYGSSFYTPATTSNSSTTTITTSTTTITSSVFALSLPASVPSLWI